MILLLVILLVICDSHVDANRRYIVQSRPSPFKLQNNFHPSHFTYGGRGWGNKGFVNSGWGNHVFGNSGWRNNGGSFNNFGNWRNNGYGTWSGGNGGLGHLGNVLIGNHGFNVPKIIVVRPGPFGETEHEEHEQIIDVKVPPPKPNVIPKEESKPTVIPEKDSEPQPHPAETDVNNNQQLQEEGQGETEAVVEIPDSANQEQFNKQNDNFGDTSETENNAAEVNSQEGNNSESSENNGNLDENTAAEVSDNVTDENKETDLKNEDHDSESVDENESYPDLTGLFDVRNNFKVGNKKNKTINSEFSFNAVRRSDSLCGIPVTTQREEIDKATLHPWLVTLGQEKNSTFSFLCGGSLIAPDLVLSSAHCFHNEVPTVAKIGNEYIPIVQTVVHGEYNISQAYNNIALIKLSRPMNSTVEVCLPNQNTFSGDKNGVEASALEWKRGSANELPKPDIMATQIFPNSQCVKDYENEHYGSYFPKGFDSTLLCVKLNMPFVCQGDSGVQLFSVDEENATYTLIGTIANPETSCGGTDYPGIYTKVSSFLPWVEEISEILQS